MPGPVTIERIIELAARGTHADLVRQKASLDLIAIQERFPDAGLPAFLEWERLEREMPVLWERYWRPFTEDRRRMLAAIDDWTLTPGLCDRLTAAMTDPVDRAIRAPTGREWLLLARLHAISGLPVPPAHMVIGPSIRSIREANPPDALPNSAGLVISRANRLSLEGVLDQGVVVFAALEDPEGPRDDFPNRALADRLTTVRAMVRGVLGCLLDGELPRRTWVVGDRAG